MRPGIVCGFVAEQRIARGISALTACGWQNPYAARQLLGQGADMLVSFGIAGALDPGLKTGNVIIPDRVMVPDGTVHHCSATLVEALRACFPAAVAGLILATPAIVSTSAGKRELLERTGAIAIDMESAETAAAATAAGIPFCVFRVIADQAGDALPAAALDGLNPDGTTAHGKIARAILRDPGQLPSLIRLGIASGRAMAVLSRSAPQLRQALTPG